MSSTELLAIIGAIGSAVAITWNFIKAIQDRAKLKVTAMVGRIIPHHADQDYLIITIINIGRRPVLVTGWGGKMKRSVKGKRVFKIIPHVPFSVFKEGEYRDEYTNDL